ncbi:hypothetical protein MKW92_005632 [Papaver armeniacum]|nr:hypothetical protein MKW92_005632 [Papaver armeniacum]
MHGETGDEVQPYPGTPEFPYGSWIVSICPTYCDTTRAMCFCGEGTKYPNRPVAETCGFQSERTFRTGWCKWTDWAKADLDNILTTNSSKPGWCNVDPKEECDCKYDGISGRFCEIPVLSVCINQCSVHVGLSVTAVSVSFFICTKWPQWLNPTFTVDIPDNSHLTKALLGIKAAGRHFKFECVNRIYDDLNATVWTEQLYGSQEHMGLRSSLTLDFYKKAYDHIVEQYPFWNRSSGRDHIWSFSWDEGACYAPKEIWNSMIAYWLNNWDAIPSSSRATIHAMIRRKILSLKDRKLFYFNGNLGPASRKRYSMGIRQKLAEEFGSTPDTKGKLGRQHADDVIVTPARSDHYYKDLSSSVFCGVLPGDGWSGRMEDGVLHGCIPVVIQDGIFLPYENVLKLSKFCCTNKIWQRFLYRDSILLEAERQKTTFGHVEDWAVEFLRLTEDDVFSTFIQVLHYKLHHDPWRQKVSYLKKEYGVPKDCLK